MRSYVVLLLTTSIGLGVAVLSGIDSTSVLLLNARHNVQLDTSLQRRDIDYSLINLQRRGKGKGKGKPPQQSHGQANPPATTPESRSGAGSGSSRRQESQSQEVTSPGTTRPQSSLEGGGEGRAGAPPSSSSGRKAKKQGNPQAQVSLSRVREVPDSGAVLASSPGAVPATGHRHSRVLDPKPGSPSRQLGKLRLSSSAQPGSGSSTSSPSSDDPRSRTQSPHKKDSRPSSPDRPSTSVRDAPGESRSPSPDRPSTSGRPASGPRTPSLDRPSTSRKPASIPMAPPPNRSPDPSRPAKGSTLPLPSTPPQSTMPTAGQLLFHRWFDATKAEVNAAKANAAGQAGGKASGGGRSALAKEKKDAAAKKNKAKEMQTESSQEYRNAKVVMAANEPGNRQSNYAFIKSNVAANAAVVATKNYADAEELVAERSKQKNKWTDVAKHTQAAGRAYQQSVVRNAGNRAFQDRYAATVTNRLAKSLPPDDPDRREAFKDAIDMRKIYTGSVGKYREQRELYKDVRKEFSGSDSEDSEMSFSDVPRT